MTRILVTGGSSFIGRALSTRLAEQGNTVHLLARPTTDLSRMPDNICTSFIHELDGTFENLIDIVAGIRPALTFHLAGQYLREVGSDGLDSLIRNNISFSAQLFESLCRTDSGRLIVNTGSYAQYADDGSPEALNFYGATKHAAEVLLNYYVRAEGFFATTLVLHDTYGPNDWRDKFINALQAAQSEGSMLALPDEDIWMDLVHVDDVVAAYEKALEYLVTKPEKVCQKSFFVSLDKLHRISDILKIFTEIGGQPVKVGWGQYELPSRRIVSPYRGPVLPGWRASISLEDGVRQLLKGTGKISS